MSNFGLYKVCYGINQNMNVNIRSFCSQWISEVPSIKEQGTEKNIMETYTYKE